MTQRLSKRDWLMTGVEILREKGAPALTIEALTTRLGVTKGSFYHHFQGFAGFKTALLALFENEGTLQVIAQMPQGNPTEKINHLFDVAAVYPQGFDVALRAWALQDEEVRQTQERVDVRRVEYLHELFLEAGFEGGAAMSMAKLAYAILIGCMQIQPPLAETETRAFLAEFQRLYGLV